MISGEMNKIQNKVHLPQIAKANSRNDLTNNFSNKSLNDFTNDSTKDSIILANMETYRNLSYRLPDKPAYILRLDDVQTPTWSDISMKIISDTLSRNMSISIGIIPYRNRADTTGIIEFIRENKDNPRLEIAQHGFAHSYYEFDNLSANNATTITMKGLRSLYHDYNTCPVTFIPPNNAISSYNNSTPNILYDVGFRIMSSYGDVRYEGNILDVGSNVNTHGKGNESAEELINECNEDFQYQNLSVIMIHPQDFVDDDHKTINNSKYALYIDMLDKLKATGAQSITFRDLLNEGETI
jgi:hypothetical protein